MSISVHHTSVTTFEVMLNAFSGILDKAAAHAEAKKFENALDQGWDGRVSVSYTHLTLPTIYSV